MGRKMYMDYKLKNGFVMELTNEGEEIENTYLEVTATGYHGDMDYDVNNHTKVYFNDSEEEFKNLICFICFKKAKDFSELKEEYQKLFGDGEAFDNMLEEWEDFCEDYSERHDQTIELNTNYDYIIEGKQYGFGSVKLDIFK
jgi:hypothetical protein